MITWFSNSLQVMLTDEMKGTRAFDQSKDDLLHLLKRQFDIAVVLEAPRQTQDRMFRVLVVHVFALTLRGREGG